jgi:hypothetical protein
MRRLALGIWPRAAYDRTVDAATPRKLATSWVVHQSVGRPPVTSSGYSASVPLKAHRWWLLQVRAIHGLAIEKTVPSGRWTASDDTPDWCWAAPRCPEVMGRWMIRDGIIDAVALAEQRRNLPNLVVIHHVASLPRRHAETGRTTDPGWSDNTWLSSLDGYRAGRFDTLRAVPEPEPLCSGASMTSPAARRDRTRRRSGRRG